MKNYRSIFPVVMVVLMVLSWYSLVSGSVQSKSEYKSTLDKAREYASQGITKYAVEHYKKALDMNNTPDIYAEVADYYKSQNDMRHYHDWCEEFVEQFPTETIAYEYAVASYKDKSDYDECFNILKTAEKRGLTSDTLKAYNEELAYVFELNYGSYDQVGVYSYNYCPVKNNDLWGFVDRYGNQRVSFKYLSVSAYSDLGFAGVVASDGTVFAIDKSGDKVKIPKVPVKSLGIITDSLVVAQLENGKYTYLNGNLEEGFGEYDFASNFSNERAAVKNGNTWKIIDAKGNQINKTDYLDVKLDEKNVACRNNRMFVSVEAGKYIMVDEKCNQVGNDVFENTHLFLGEAPAAVQINGAWLYINEKGEAISDKTYQEARSFSNGLAAVCIDGKWGFIDSAENIVIDTQFDSAMDFNEKGSCFIKEGDSWRLLRIFRLNREG